MKFSIRLIKLITAVSVAASVCASSVTSDTVTTPDALNLKTVNPSLLQGPFTAILHITNVNGTPAAGKTYKIIWSESGFTSQTIAQGIIPKDGIVHVKNLGGVDKESDRANFNATGGIPTFDVYVGDQNIGYMMFGESRGEKVYPPEEGKSKTYTYQIPPGIGDAAPAIEVFNLETSKTMHLADLEGQIVLIDFWATWCGPCRPVMEKLQSLSKRRAQEWTGKVTILTVSIDDDPFIVRKHIQKNGWDATMNGWAPAAPDDPERVGWYAPAAEAFGIQETPTMLLIDSSGTIQNRGDFDAEKEIEGLINSTN